MDWIPKVIQPVVLAQVLTIISLYGQVLMVKHLQLSGLIDPYFFF